MRPRNHLVVVNGEFSRGKAEALGANCIPFAAKRGKEESTCR